MIGTSQIVNALEAARDVVIEFLAMIPIISERRVDLAERQVRMLEVQLFGAPSISLLLDNQIHNLHRRTGDARSVVFVQRNTSIARLQERPSHSKISQSIEANKVPQPSPRPS